MYVAVCYAMSTVGLSDSWLDQGLDRWYDEFWKSNSALIYSAVVGMTIAGILIIVLLFVILGILCRDRRYGVQKQFSGYERLNDDSENMVYDGGMRMTGEIYEDNVKLNFHPNPNPSMVYN